MINQGPRYRSGPEPGTTRHILVVQHDHQEALRTAQCIQQHGHLVACLTDAWDAADLVNRSPFDMVVVEWPHGKDVLNVLRGKQIDMEKTRVIILTSPSTVEQVIEAHEYGLGLVLSKPVRSDCWAKFVAAL